MALVVSLKLIGDAGNLVQSLDISEQSLREFGQAARVAETEARATAAGLGATETAARQAATATRSYTSDIQQQARAIAAYDDQLDAQAARLQQTRAALNPYVAAQQQYLARLNEVSAALKVGAVNEIEATRARDLARASYARNLTALRQTTAATREHTGAMKLQSYQTANLVQQMQDVVVQLGSGQNPAVILLQQGPQITSAVGGVRNALALVAPYFTATTVSVGTLTAGLVVGAAAWNSYLASTKAVQAASEGLGRSIGASAGDLETIARSGANAGDISVRSAREAETAFLNTGRIGTDTMRGLISISRDYAATMGMDLSAAIDDLGKKFADPAKGAEELSHQLDAVDANTANYVRTLASQNRLQEAQTVLLASLRLRLSSASEGATALGRAWHDVSVAASNAWDWMGKAIDRAIEGPEVSQENLAQAQANAAALRATLAQSSGFTDMALAPATQKMRADLAFLEQWIATAQAKLSQTKADADRDLRNRASSQAGAVTRQLTPGAADLETLRAQQSALKRVLDDPSTFARTNNLAATADAYDRVTHAIETYLTPAQRAAEADRLATQALTAKTPAEKAAVAAAQKRLELAGQSVTSGEAEAQSLSAGNLARAQAAQAIADQNRELNANARATLAVADAYLVSGQAAQEAEARRQALSEALRSGADVTIQARLHLQEMAAAEAESGAQAVRAANDQAEAQKKLNDAVLSGRQTFAQANQQAQLDAQLKPLLIAQANAEGAAKDALTRVIDALTAAYARLNAEQQRGAAADMLQSQQEELATLRLQTSLVGRDARARADLTAQLQAEQQARRAGIDLRTEQGQAILANVRLIAEETLALERQNDAYDTVASTFERALNRVDDALAEGKISAKDWGDTLISIAQDVLHQFYKLAITAPIMNSLFGTNYATISDVGGIVGSFFHKGGVVGQGSNDNRVVSPFLWAGAPRFHAGGLASNERAIIVEEDEEIVTADNPRHINNIRRAASSSAAGPGGGDAAPIVNVTIQNAPGTTSEVSQRQEADGSLTLEVIGRQLEDYLGNNIASGKGALHGAVRDKFGLNPNAQLRRG